MVKQADVCETDRSRRSHKALARALRHAAQSGYLWERLGDQDATEAEYHEACAEGRTTAAEESDDE